MRFSPPSFSPFARRFPFSLHGPSRWGLFLFMVLIQFAAFAYMGWRWHNIAVDGIPYQWRAVPRLELSSFGTDYIRVVFPEDTTQWRDADAPEEGQQIYVYISRDPSGLMKIQGASAEKPLLGSDYMRATVVSYHDGSVQFQVGFDRYRMAPEMRDGIYDLQADDSVIASIRIKRGEGVIEGLFVNGIPMESMSNGAVMAKARQDKDGQTLFNKPHLVDSGMVPPKEE
ncbi:hypothetical protein [Megasphaera sp.]|uniref:hypothetical protein n=1 Tax=Megasphaera sp. TaxID=2023260 RepID=UPI0025F78A63|nr:hypothetical protein [uncultured Megasphaera sp.]